MSTNIQIGLGPMEVQRVEKRTSTRLKKVSRVVFAAFFSKVELDISGCWVWRAARNANSYGVFQGESAHRTAYRWFVGEIPSGFQVDHLCRNRWCVNPAHLEAVTASQNVLRGIEARGYCRRGHPWIPENIRRWKNSRDTYANFCVLCARERSRNSKRAKRAS